MNKDMTLSEALDASIIHWDEHANRKRNNPPHREDTLGGECALCKLYANNSCHGCPIREKEEVIPENGDDFDEEEWEDCAGSPWQAAFSAGSVWRDAIHRTVLGFNSVPALKAHIKFIAAANAMRGYLVELRANQ